MVRDNRSTGWRRVAALAVAALTYAAGAGSARAAVDAYEPFNYTAPGDPLNGKTGGGEVGFSAPWAGAPQFQIGTGSLSAPGAGPSPVVGNRAALPTAITDGSTFPSITRNLSTTIGTAGTTKFLSFLLRPEGTLGQGNAGGYFGVELRGSGPDLYVGFLNNGSNDLGMNTSGGGGDVGSGVDAVSGTTYLMVVRLDFVAGNDTATLYVNPTPGGAAPASGTVKNDIDLTNVTQLGLTASGAFSVDEIRIGDTFADVTPVPEPTTVGAIALVGAAALLRRRRASL